MQQLYWKKTAVTSSSEIYGKSTAAPLAEDGDRVLGPTSVGRWPYSSSKAIDEYFALAYAKRCLPVVVLRYFNSYGPRLDPKGYGSVIAKFIGQAMRGEPLTVYSDGQQTRCFTYIDDAVQGTILAAMAKEAKGEVFNIGSSHETTILAHLIKGLIGSSDIVHVPYAEAYGEDFEGPRRLPDVSKAERLLGFRAEIPLEEGLKRRIEWFSGQ